MKVGAAVLMYAAGKKLLWSWNGGVECLHDRERLVMCEGRVAESDQPLFFIEEALPSSVHWVAGVVKETHVT